MLVERPLVREDFVFEPLHAAGEVLQWESFIMVFQRHGSLRVTMMCARGDDMTPQRSGRITAFANTVIRHREVGRRNADVLPEGPGSIIVGRTVHACAAPHKLKRRHSFAPFTNSIAQLQLKREIPGNGPGQTAGLPEAARIVAADRNGQHVQPQYYLQ
jgi:hypothetical protein